jgi:two-component system, chemotaxis family, protein-glutamate methylesterase/glutaminase
MSETTRQPIRVLVVDDSALNRESITSLLRGHPDIEVIGKAADGEEALRMVTALKPDIVTLDLEMPRMDGFTLLRIVMSKLPTPVIVVSSYSQKENVFKALELGALDFVAKPDRYLESHMETLREELVGKVLVARSLRTRPAPLPIEPPEATKQRPGAGPARAPRRIIAIASSTGGPSALMEVIPRIPAETLSAVLIAQHMPDKFTRTFAERLDRRSSLQVSEGADQDAVSRGSGIICPGRMCMELDGTLGAELRIRIVPPGPSDRYVPSADRLFRSVARVAGAQAVGIILTGMGDDGVLGAQAILRAGGQVIAESEATAVVFGMPGAAVRANAVTRILPLPAIAEWLAAGQA